MKIRKLAYIVALAMIALCGALAASCNDANAHKHIITVSIQPQKWLLEKIVDNHFDVICLLSQGSNPETYEPSMNHLINLEKSDAYFRIGYIGFEMAIVDKAKKNNPELKIFDNSKGISVIYGSHEGVAYHEYGEGHHHEIDPHIWTSVANARIISQNMCDAVCELEPKHSKEYQKNLKTLFQELDKLDEELRNTLKNVSTKSFLVWHPSLSYFARDYGLRQISMEYEGKEIPAKYLKSEIDTALASKAQVFFFQKEFDCRQVEVINQQIGAKVVTINPMNYDWDLELKHIANALAKTENN